MYFVLSLSYKMNIKVPGETEGYQGKTEFYCCFRHNVNVNVNMNECQHISEKKKFCKLSCTFFNRILPCTFKVP